MTEPSKPELINGDHFMKRYIACCLVATLISACAPALSRAQDGGSIPAEYHQAITPSHLKSYFDSHPAPPGERYGTVQIDGDAVVVEIQTWIGSTPIGTATIRLVPEDTGRRLEVTCEAKSPGTWLYLERDAQLFREGITRYVMAGDHLNAVIEASDPEPQVRAIDPKLQGRLIDAVRDGEGEQIDYWLGEGADINGAGVLYTPLTVAISYDRGIKLIEYLIDKGADVNKAGPGFPAGRTPLMAAAYEVQPEVVALLLKRGADANLADGSGKTALSYVMESSSWGFRGDKLSTIFRALIAAGAKHDRRDEKGMTPLSYGVANNSVPTAIIDLLKSEDIRKAVADLELKEQRERALQAKREAEEAQKRQQAERAAQAKRKAMLAKLAKLGPVGILSRDISYNSIGVPEATIKVVNVWNKTIDAYRVEIRCQDNFGRFLTAYGWGRESRFYGLSQDILKPGEESDDTWTLHGYKNATKFYARIIEVHFTDKTTWRAR